MTWQRGSHEWEEAQTFNTSPSAPQGLDAERFGSGASAAGGNAIAIGRLANASRANSLVIGKEASVSGNNSIAIGRSAAAAAQGTVIGANSQAGVNSFALGYFTFATGARSVAIGRQCVASHDDSISMGYDVDSTAVNRMSVGNATTPIDLELSGSVGEFGATPPSSQPAAIADVAGTAGGSYTATEQGMINDLKAQLNSLLAVVRARGTIAT